MNDEVGENYLQDFRSLYETQIKTLFLNLTCEWNEIE